MLQCRFNKNGIATAILLAVMANMAGCNIIAPIGGLVENYKRQSTHAVPEEYRGLAGKRYAVLVIVDRIIQGDNPDIVPYLTTKITERLIQEQQLVGAAGVIPADRLLNYLYDHPRWLSMPRDQLAKELGVERLIVVEVIEYRLTEPGNQYLWDGVAAGTVGVIEVDTSISDEFAFEKSVRVTFPDKQGYGPSDFSRPELTTALALRFLDRVTWPFYNHQEPYYPKY